MRMITDHDNAERLSCPTLPEIRDAVIDETRRVGREMGLIVETRGGRRRPTPANLLNWLACAYLSLPEAERDRLIRRGKAVYDRRAASDTPIPIPSPDDEGGDDE